MSITGAGQKVGGSTTVSLSPNNTVQLIGFTASSYCLKATHSGAAAWYYENTTGGISKTVCAS